MSSTAEPAESWVGDYRLLSRIGEGGMGVVHLAQAPDGERVALKVLRPHVIGDDESRERLAREVASLRRVTSPRIAEIIDADPWGPTPYVATRYVPGLSLHEHTRREGPIRGEDLRWFAKGLAEALVAVHSVGVLHRDIKPSNVLLEGRAPVLIDFGLARLAEDPRLTATGWLLGTPGYLAPEILYGEDATTASDVHSWAATVVFAATGRPPFGKGPAMAIMDRVRRGEHDLTGVPEELVPLLRDCLAAEAEDRPGTAAILDALRRPDEPTPVQVADEHTVPLAALGFLDDDPTDVLPRDAATGRVAQPRSWRQPPQPRDLPAEAPEPTRMLTQHVPPPPYASPYESAYPPPYQSPYQSPYDAPYAPAGPLWQQPLTGLARVQRGAVLVGLFALVAVGFAAAPYLALVGIAVVGLLLRTFSWASESGRERKVRRGYARWYDGPLTALSSPWYLLVASGGTLMLLLWSAVLAFVVGVAYLLFAVPMGSGLLTMGAVLALALWWGPGSRRLRRSTRGLATAAARSSWAGWSLVGLLFVGVAVCAYLLGTSGTDWTPQPGPPWRPGTVLGDVAGYM